MNTPGWFLLQENGIHTSSKILITYTSITRLEEPGPTYTKFSYSISSGNGGASASSKIEKVNMYISNNNTPRTSTYDVQKFKAC